MRASPLEYVVGAVSSANLRAALGFSPPGWRPDDWVALLHGEAILSDNDRLEYDQEAGGFTIEMTTATLRQRLWLEPATGHLMRIALFEDEDEEPEYGLEITEREAHGLPRMIKIMAAPEDLDAVLKLQRAIPRAEIPLGLFTLPIPPGAVVGGFVE